MPRFVILEHDQPVLHWDLMLEAGDVLQTWRLAAPPAESQTVEATALGDHRRMYLDYEGPISENRGAVSRWDAGSFTEESGSIPPVRALCFYGKHITGCWRLEHAGGSHWRFARLDLTAPAAS